MLSFSFIVRCGDGLHSIAYTVRGHGRSWLYWKYSFCYLVYLLFFFTQQGSQRKLSVKIQNFPFSDEFWGHCVLKGEFQRRTLP